MRATYVPRSNGGARSGIEDESERERILFVSDWEAPGAINGGLIDNRRKTIFPLRKVFVS